MPELKTMPVSVIPPTTLAQMPATMPAARTTDAGGRMAPKGRAPRAATVPQAEAPVVERPVIYPDERAEICRGVNAICEHHAVQILDWVTEAQYQARMMARQPGSEAGQWVFGDVFMLRDCEGNKVRCLNNLDNRPFDERWCKGLMQTILKFQWAGSITVSELVKLVYGKAGMKDWKDAAGVLHKVGDVIEMCAGTINGSSISVSRTGRVESGQHSLCALILACQVYRAAARGTYPEWDKFLETYQPKSGWKDRGPAPVIETILVTGLSEDQRVLMTVDNCKPRSEMDVLYTSDIFVKHRGQPSKRQELARMTAVCFDMFWKRTQRQGYKTHGEMMQVIGDHPRLIKAVEHLFVQNADAPAGAAVSAGGKLITNLGLSAGQSSCLMYLMGCSASDGDAYRNGKPAPKEKGLDWSRWDKAKDFWAMLGGNAGFEPVRRALLTKVVNFDNSVSLELSGGVAQQTKFTILAKAWEVFVSEGRQFTDLDLAEGGCLHLHYTPASESVVDGKVVYTSASLAEDAADFGGIDVPGKEDVESEGTPRTQAEMDAAKETARLGRAEVAS